VKSRSVVVRCEHGLHARVAATVAKTALSHESTVHIRCQGCPCANACSILELLRLGAAAGAHLEVTADGPDENAVIEALAEVFEQGGGV
jgi:phosphocarrier protein HPr